MPGSGSPFGPPRSRRAAGADTAFLCAGSMKHLVQVESAKEAAGGAPSAGPTYRCAAGGNGNVASPPAVLGLSTATSIQCKYTCNTCATITRLAVKENCRRQGHGEALLAAALERCRRRKIQRLSFHVDPTRMAAVALYRKAGFQVVTTVEGYYAPHRDAYRMYFEVFDLKNGRGREPVLNWPVLQ